MPVKAERGALAEENEGLRARLLELEETLRAIRSGEVDALVVETAGESQVFTLKSADLTYRVMVEAMQKGAATLSEDGLALYCNPFLAALLDVPVETVVGSPLSGFLDEQAAASLSALLRAAENGVSRGEVSFRKGRDSVPTQVSLTLLPLEGAHVFCMIVTDLTERKRGEAERAQLEREQMARAAAEEANRTALHEIERRKGVEESLLRAEKDRTRLLALERAARTEAEEANRLKDEFLATLSHELRTPLTAIVGWAHLLHRGRLSPDATVRAVDTIIRNATAQNQIIDELLDVSRIITGKFQMSLSPVRLHDVIESAADTVRHAAQAREVELDLTIDPSAGPVLGDASRLQQVIWNLLSNAIRFAPVGGRVEVRVSAVGSWVEISVTDDGAGIDFAFLPYVFDRFRQADSSSTRPHTGLGLGLAITRYLVELHGGSVEARNREGRSGAVFIVRLPRPIQASTDRRPAEGDQPIPRAQPPRAAPSLEDVTVLLVDDSEDTREAVAMALAHYGARVTAASSARQAFDILVQERPQVLVADIGMPGEDGHTLLKWVRSLPVERGGATPAMALTAYASEQDSLAALRAGFQMHLSKPVTPAELATAVESLVGAVRNGTALLPGPSPTAQESPAGSPSVPRTFGARPKAPRPVR